MKRKRLYMVREEEGGPEWLSDDKAYYFSARSAGAADLTLEAVADFLDQDAEDCNAHDFVRCHRGLAALLAKEGGRELATAALRRLADFGGLHGMNGVCGRGDPRANFKALGVPLGGGDWRAKE